MSASRFTGGSPRRIWGLVYRHLCLYRGSWPRLLELAYWPTLSLFIWGATANFMSNGIAGGGTTGAIAMAGSMVIGGALLWEVALRSQIGVAMVFMEEIWSRNLGHVFVSPLRPWELLAGLIVMALLRTIIGLAPAVLLAWGLYHFDLFALGPLAVLFIANLMLMGWWVALGILSLILRHGAGAEALAWTVMFGFTPFAAVYYPVSILPEFMQPVALALPAAHVFEGLRTLLSGGNPWGQLGMATGLNLLWAGAALLLFAQQFRAARIRGALLTIGE